MDWKLITISLGHSDLWQVGPQTTTSVLWRSCSLLFIHSLNGLVISFQWNMCPHLYALHDTYAILCLSVLCNINFERWVSENLCALMHIPASFNIRFAFGKFFCQHMCRGLTKSWKLDPLSFDSGTFFCLVLSSKVCDRPVHFSFFLESYFSGYKFVQTTFFSTEKSYCSGDYHFFNLSTLFQQKQPANKGNLAAWVSSCAKAFPKDWNEDVKWRRKSIYSSPVEFVIKRFLGRSVLSGWNYFGFKIIKAIVPRDCWVVSVPLPEGTVARPHGVEKRLLILNPFAVILKMYWNNLWRRKKMDLRLPKS